ncbi:MAG: hypothetical protein LBV06_08620 [Propionibacteriaceae bacterium]|jgi:hypothetical protein|nr:hypothetical protein [Propionibacteriaceae bacterium]
MGESRLPRRLRAVLARNPEFGRVRQAQVYRPGAALNLLWIGLTVAVCLLGLSFWNASRPWWDLALCELVVVALFLAIYSLMHVWLVVCDRGVVIGGWTVITGTFTVPYALMDFSRFSIVRKPGWLLVGSNDARHGHGSGVWAKWAMVFRARDTAAVMRTRDHVMRLAAAGPPEAVFNSVWLRFACHEFPSGLVGQICSAAAEAGFPQAMTSPALTQPPVELTIRDDNLPPWLRD